MGIAENFKRRNFIEYCMLPPKDDIRNWLESYYSNAENPAFRHNFANEFIFAIPCTEEDFQEFFKDAPERMKKILREAYEYAQLNFANTGDLGYILLWWEN